MFKKYLPNSLHVAEDESSKPLTSTSASDTSATTAADIYAGAINKSNKEVDNDFDNSLGCK